MLCYLQYDAVFEHIHFWMIVFVIQKNKKTVRHSKVISNPRKTVFWKTVFCFSWMFLNVRKRSKKRMLDLVKICPPAHYTEWAEHANISVETQPSVKQDLVVAAAIFHEKVVLTLHIEIDSPWFPICLNGLSYQFSKIPRHVPHHVLASWHSLTSQTTSKLSNCCMKLDSILVSKKLSTSFENSFQ